MLAKILWNHSLYVPVPHLSFSLNAILAARLVVMEVDAFTVAPSGSTSSSTETPSDQTTAAVGTSAGLIGAILLIAVLGAIILVRRHVRKTKHDLGSEFTSSNSVEDPEMGQLERVIRQRSREAGSLSASYWSRVDPGMREVLEKRLIDDTRLELESELGRGNGTITCMNK